MSRDITVADTIQVFFTTRAFATGIPTVLAGTPVVSAYEDADLVQITAGVTLTVDHDSVVGLNRIAIVATGANGFETGKDYHLVITTGTVDGVSVVGEVVGDFQIGRSASAIDLANATDGLGALKTETAAILVDTGTTLDGRIPTALVAGRMDSSVGANAADVITAASMAADASAEIADAVWDEDATAHQTLGTFGQAIGDPVSDAKTLFGAIITDAVGASVTADVATIQTDTDDIQTRLPTVLVGGRMDSDVAALQANVITAASIAASAMNGKGDWETPILTGTADAGGSTTSMVDAALVEINDEFNGAMIRFTSGGLDRQARLITDFDAATDTITFAPAVTETLAAGFTYEIWQHAGVDIQSWLGVVTGLSAPNALVGGAMDSDVSALQANVITAAAINAAALTAAKFAAGAIDANALATDAVNEIVDQVWDELQSDHVAGGSMGEIATEIASILVDTNALNDLTIAELAQGVPTATPTLQNAVMLLYMAMRNKLDVTTSAADFLEVHNDADVVIAKKSLTDASGDYSEAKMVTGP